MRVAVQEFASVIVTVYVPATLPVIPVVVAPVDQAYAKVPIPPDAVTDAEPFEPPLQLTFVKDVLAEIGLGCVTVPEEVVVHPFASVIVTV